MQQADDFCAENAALHTLLAPLDATVFEAPTLFKGWTVNDILQHLHHFNILADLSLNEPDKFVAAYGEVQRLRETLSVTEASNQLLDGLKGPALLAAWQTYYREMTPRFAAADPRQRVKWAGPDMSARSSITARLMETWAHGQAIYDLLGKPRTPTARLRNIAHLGVNTFAWTFANRGETAPGPMPYVALEAPADAPATGAEAGLWTWGEATNQDRIEGPAEAFCQVVCQTRNIADTTLRVSGPVAEAWMAKAQCFAGPPREPPAPGARRCNPAPEPGWFRTGA